MCGHSFSRHLPTVLHSRRWELRLMDNILAAAQIIATARRNRSRLPSLPADIAPQTEADGYRIQRAVHDLLLPQVGAMVGYKIGCTSAVMQQYLNIPHPCGGGVFANGVHDSGVSLRSQDFVRVGVECEIAVRLGRTCRHRRRRSPLTPSRWRSRPIIPRSRSSTSAMSTGRASARRLWWPMISMPPVACSESRWRDPRCRSAQGGRPRHRQRCRSRPRHRRRCARSSA